MLPLELLVGALTWLPLGSPFEVRGHLSPQGLRVGDNNSPKLVVAKRTFGPLKLRILRIVMCHRTPGTLSSNVTGASHGLKFQVRLKDGFAWERSL